MNKNIIFGVLIVLFFLILICIGCGYRNRDGYKKKSNTLPCSGGVDPKKGCCYTCDDSSPSKCGVDPFISEPGCSNKCDPNVKSTCANRYASIRSYLEAVFPQFNSSQLSDSKCFQLYHSLGWYYLPLVDNINKTRRGPTTGPYTDIETQWFMADGTDCGDYDSTPGTFSCSVFGGACQSSEFGSKSSGGLPYYNISFIKPYGKRDGNPNNSYIECVAFACEGLGRMLLNSGWNSCKSTAPTWDQFLANFPKHTIREDYNLSDIPSFVLVNNQEQVQKYLDTLPEQASAPSCPWPQTLDPFYKDCGVACGYTNCDVTSNCNWEVNGKNWEDYLSTTKDSYYTIIQNLQYSKPYNASGEVYTTPRNDESPDKTMFYWCPGYGKFLNMGKTGIYMNYFHFLLTCPKLAADGKTKIRWSFPQILQTATMAAQQGEAGNSELKRQYEALISGKYYDKRQYLEGYVTSLRDTYKKGYQGNGGVIVNNKMKFTTENEKGLLNPGDDTNLQNVDKYTITQYYDPDSNITNPQYNKKIKFAPIEAAYLLQGMHIYGATGSSRKYPTIKSSGVSPSNSTFPFGVFFAGANLGHCVYTLTSLLGWNSSQFTQMPTGAGSYKYCNNPEYDYEIVYIDDKDWVCNNAMQMIDPSQDFMNYTLYGFVQGTGNHNTDVSKLNAIDFDASKMRLTERNVPDPGDKYSKYKQHPNALNYTLPTDYVCDTTKCPYSDGVYNKIYKEYGGINYFNQDECK